MRYDHKCATNTQISEHLYSNFNHFRCKNYWLPRSFLFRFNECYFRL